MVADITLHRRAFWAFFAEQLPELAARTVRGNETTRWLQVGHLPLIAAHYVSANAAGLFVRGARGTRPGHIRELLFPYRDLFANALGRPDLRLGERFLLVSRLRADMQDMDNWPTAIGWFAEHSPVYEKMLEDVQR